MSSPGQDPGAVIFPREQYEALESAVMEIGARPLVPLAEYARRNRAADTLTLLDALKNLESVAADTAKPVTRYRGRWLRTIKAARSEIASAHHDLLPDGGYLSPTDRAL